MIIKKILSLAASIISLVILKFFFFSNSIAGENNIKYFSKDNGIVGLMYHRFNENKYPSTNIRMEIFKKQMKIIRDSKYEFYDPNKLEKEFNIKKDKKKILISIDDAFRSF